MSQTDVVPPGNLFAAWRTQDLDDPDNVERMIEGAQTFFAENTVGGVYQFDPDHYNYNMPAFPQRPLEEPASPDVIVKFTSIEQFKEIHKTASAYEDALETKDVDDFNKEGNSFKAWPILSMPEDDDVTQWLILVEPTQSIETRIPDIGGCCQLRLVNHGTDEGVSAWWTAKRKHNNFASAGVAKASWSKLIAFNVTLVKSEDETNSVIHALIPSDGNQHEHLANLQLTRHNAVSVGLFFTKSDATFDAEMKSLSKLVKASKAPPETPLATIVPNPVKTAMVEDWLNLPPDQRPDTKPIVIKKPKNPRAVQAQQVAAFKYLLDFHEPEFTIDMFDVYPHMLNPNRPGSGIPPAIMKKYSRMDEHQRRAYEGLLSKMPCGVALLPGGPGGGKTDWVMTVIGVMQSKSRAKVLYLLDINGPLDDATAKYIQLMRNAGLAKRAIRMRTFGTEMKKSARVGAIDGRPQVGSEEPSVDFSRNFLALYTQHATGTAPEPTRTRHHQIIPTLDEAAWNHYDEHRDEFADLTLAIELCNGSALENRALRFQIFLLYTAVLHQADFIATTPCVAATVFSRMFIPDLVVFDEAAHARELSTLISIANFCPKAGWIFIGDHRQTQPTVKSNNTNPFGKQLATSAMERAYMAGVLDHQLLINHRAYGRLERLPSKLIYDGKMVSGIPHLQRFPRWMNFVRSILEHMAGERCSTPRIIIHLHGWTMDKVLELIKDVRFRSAENERNQGTILLLAPYKAAVAKYQEAIEELAKAHPNLRIPQRVEARTWDSSQGHEADIVGIDYVREYPTGFMDGMYRFNVGLTRARQGEWHLMHPNMPRAESFRKTKYLRKLYSACEQGLDGLGEGRIANLMWGVPTPPVPFRAPRTHSTKAPTAGAASDKDNGAGVSAPATLNEESPDMEAGQEEEEDNDDDDDKNRSSSNEEPGESPSTMYTHSSAVNSQTSLVQAMPELRDASPIMDSSLVQSTVNSPANSPVNSVNSPADSPVSLPAESPADTPVDYTLNYELNYDDVVW
ncbi:hypothetical protein SCUCBS95973_009529 [Sporothrix curviconia]|uniref:Uncharacterized protein n=1 Tax=Sporothrix curviconia TaxID=1260050 RepID=A0ABP0CXB8_9PEZI